MADLVFVFYSNCFCRLLTEILKLRILSFFAKHFKLYCQLIERKPEKRKPASVRGYLRESSPFTSFLLTFGKLTIEFEMLYK